VHAVGLLFASPKIKKAAGSTGTALTGTVLTFVGLPGLKPLPWWQTVAVFLYAVVACLPVSRRKVNVVRLRVTGTSTILPTIFTARAS
jgi:hypothetical protein